MGIEKHLHGLQHIGLPCRNMEETTEFYQKLGMKIAYSTVNNGQKVAFLQQDTMMIEAYEEPIVGHSGAINHICFDVDDIEGCFRAVQEMGLQMADGEIHDLPFWENGVKYFIIIGPNAERVEFCQKL